MDGGGGGDGDGVGGGGIVERGRWLCPNPSPYLSLRSPEVPFFF